MLNLKDLFEKHNDQFLKFENVKNPAHPVPDICAFLMLAEISPQWSTRGDTRIDMVASAEHDEIWLQGDPKEVATNATEAQVVDLIRCGVMYDEDYDSFHMFV